MSGDASAAGKRIRLSILTYIEEYVNANQGKPPTVIEIKDALGLKSKSHVQYHLERLAASGYLELSQDHKSRGIALSGIVIGRVLKREEGTLTIRLLYEGKVYQGTIEEVSP